MLNLEGVLSSTRMGCSTIRGIGSSVVGEGGGGGGGVEYKSDF